MQERVMCRPNRSEYVANQQLTYKLTDEGYNMQDNMRDIKYALSLRSSGKHEGTRGVINNDGKTGKFSFLYIIAIIIIAPTIVEAVVRLLGM
jgi:hypothetical protein